MLIHRCPNLEELAIEGTSSLPTNVHSLIDGRWPNLHKLDLGDVSVDFLPNLSDPGQKWPFVEFLEAHPKLQTLGLSRFVIQPAHLATLDPDVLDNISTFSGTLQQLQSLPYIHPHLRSVTFRDPMQTREVPAQAVAGLLQGMKQLSKLKISFTLHSMYDSGNLLRSLITSCPHLRYLELTCGGKPSFQLVSHSPFSYPTLLNPFPGRLFENSPRLPQTPHAAPHHRQVPRRRAAVCRCRPHRAVQPPPDAFLADLPPSYSAVFSFPPDRPQPPLGLIPFFVPLALLALVRDLCADMRPPRAPALALWRGAREARVAVGSGGVALDEAVDAGFEGGEEEGGGVVEVVGGKVDGGG